MNAMAFGPTAGMVSSRVSAKSAARAADAASATTAAPRNRRRQVLMVGTLRAEGKWRTAGSSYGFAGAMLTAAGRAGSATGEMLTGRTAVVTGSTSGIGLAIARALAA